MQSKKKNALWSLIAFGLAALSIWKVADSARNLDSEDFWGFLRGANPVYLIATILCMLLYILFEGLAILRILKGFGYKRKINKGIVYAASDVYFSSITPSATGGQPASAFFMNKDGIPFGTVSVTLLLNLVLYTISILLLGVIGMIAFPEVFFNFSLLSKTLIIIGYIVFVTVTVLFVLLIYNEHWVYKIGHSFIGFFHKIHIIKKVDKKEAKLKKIVKDYAECSNMISGQGKMVFVAFLYNFMQRLVFVCVPVFVYLAGGGSFKDSLEVWCTQIMVTLGSNYVPIPGAMGISDYLLIDGLHPLLSSDMAITLDLYSRGISFYACVVLSLVITVGGYIRINKRTGKEEEES